MAAAESNRGRFMAISDVAQYAHLSESDVEALGAGLDTIRRDIEESRGAHDAAYIRRTIAFQRTLESVRGYSSPPAAPRRDG
jgi:hypothetical protein